MSCERRASQQPTASKTLAMIDKPLGRTVRRAGSRARSKAHQDDAQDAGLLRALTDSCRVLTSIDARTEQ